MNVKPILFSAPMVRAILSGDKTQTRRVTGHYYPEFTNSLYGEPGDQLWVRETWRAEELESGLDGVRYAADKAFRAIENTAEAAELWCKADNGLELWLKNKWRPSIFMPRWASRITLQIVNVRVEKLQDISEEDAVAEGLSMPGARTHFRELWDTLNADRGYSWESNPWVWVIEFTPLPAASPQMGEHHLGGDVEAGDAA